MLLTVLLLLILPTQGRGCSASATNFLNIINSTGHADFRKVFPRDYKVVHRFSPDLLCDTDPCCIFRAVAVLSDSWSQLLRQLYRENWRYGFILQMKEELINISQQKFKETPDLSALPTVSSTPESMLSYTSHVFSKWLDQQCRIPEDSCPFPTLPPDDEEDFSYWEGTTASAPYVDRRGAHFTMRGPLTGSTQTLHVVSWLLPLFWAWLPVELAL